MDFIKSGIGGETGDQTLKTVDTKPVWLLQPLPLSQVDARAETSSKGSRVSLQHLCVQRISRDFHKFSHDSFEHIPPHLIRRVFDRVCLDREYRFHEGRETSCNPDEATIWAYSLFADPDLAPQSHTLALQQATVLSHFTPNPNLRDPLHPFLHIPRLYASIPQADFQLITTLRLNGVGGAINDQSILSLKWATHLTVLWIDGCTNLSDAGIRLLSSAVELPGPILAETGQRSGREDGRGMWRLRAWFLPGCTGVTDKSMRSFARWPGLVLLDLRDTSCTSTAARIFNHASQSLFACQNADMQPCTSGLRPLFSSGAPASVIVDRLTKTLLPPCGTSSASLLYRNLNIVPTELPIPVHLKPPSAHPSGSTARPSWKDRSKTTYNVGYGQLYGAGVASISDEVQEFRRDVKVALKMQGIEEGLIAEEEYERYEPWWAIRDRKATQAEERARKKKLKGYKDADEDERSKRFAMGSKSGLRMEQGQKEWDVERIQGDAELMLVRMVYPGWEALEWHTATTQNSVKMRSMAHGDWSAGTASQRAGSQKGNLIGDILGTVSTGPLSSGIPALHRSHSSGGLQPPSSPLEPSSQTSSTSSQHTPHSSQRSSNPFSASQSAAGAPTNPFRNSQNAGSSKISKLFSAAAALSSSGQTPSPQTVLQRSLSGNGFESFVSGGQKRSWSTGVGSGGVENEPKRRGMKMFSGKRI